MKNFLIAFVVFLVWSFFGLWLYSWLQPVDNSSNGNDTIATNDLTEVPLNIDDPLRMDDSFEDSATRDTISLVENEEEPPVIDVSPTGLKATKINGDILFAYSEGIKIWKNTNQLEYANELIDFKNKLNTYLNDHPDQELHIASLYSASENIATPNYGYQRGQKIKRILETAGIDSKRMIIKSVIREIAFDENGLFQNGISFSFHPLDLERLESLKRSLPETKTIYPKLVNNDIFVNQALEDLLEEVKSALASNPSLTVQIIGHTDNIGNANDNYLLGLKYARQVRWYLVTKGKLDPKKVVAISKGESLSIATNRTERGRLLNRRIEIKYQID